MLELRERLNDQIFTRQQFDDLIKLWIEKGYGNWLITRKKQGWAFRDQFVGRLKDGKDKWEELIQTAIKRASEDERQNIQRLINEAAGDPLMILNLVGVPAALILSTLERNAEEEPLRSQKS